MRLHQFYLGIPDKLGDEYASTKICFWLFFFCFFLYLRGHCCVTSVIFLIIQSTSTHISKPGGATDVQCLDILMM